MADDAFSADAVDSVRELRRLWSTARAPRSLVVAMIALGFVTSCLDGIGIGFVVLFLYAAFGSAEDIVATEGFFGEVFAAVIGWLGSDKLLIGALVVAFVAASALLRYVYGVLSESMSQDISERIRVRLHEQYLDVAYDFIRRQPPAALLNLIEDAAWTVSDVTANVLHLLVSVCTILVFSALLVTTSWQFTLAALAGFVVIFLLVRLLTRQTAHWSERAVEADNALTKRALTTLSCLRTIRVSGDDMEQKRQFASDARRVRDVFVKMEKLAETASPVSEIAYVALLCLFIGGASIFGLSFAGSLAAVALLHRMRPHAQALEDGSLELSAAYAKLLRLRRMLDRSDKSYLPTGFHTFEGLQRGICFENVTLRYGDAPSPALQDVSFFIPAGVTTALVGPSGAGKSTIVNLLLRLYRPDAGTIRVDGTDLDDIERSGWLKSTALAGQDVELTEGTIGDNIRLARSDASDDELERAAEYAGIDSVVRARPEGFDALVGERGLSISAGQRQRVALARAFLRRPQLLILDEAMSALDRQLEDRVRENIDACFAGRTVLLITHRLETILNAQHVVCIDRGRIVEEGTPDDLLSRPTSALRRMMNWSERTHAVHERPHAVNG